MLFIYVYMTTGVFIMYLCQCQALNHQMFSKWFVFAFALNCPKKACTFVLNDVYIIKRATECFKKQQLSRQSLKWQDVKHTKMQICTNICLVTVHASITTIGSLFKFLFKECTIIINNTTVRQLQCGCDTSGSELWPHWWLHYPEVWENIENCKYKYIGD